MQLFADRFVITDEGCVIDLATGENVVLITTSAGGQSEQMRWTLRCDWFFRLHHRRIARLIDYGLSGETRRFEAWRAGATWRESAGETERTLDEGVAFLRANALTEGELSPDCVRTCEGRAVLVPDAATGYETSTSASLPAGFRLEACGLAAVERRGVSAVAEMLASAWGARPRAVSLWGPPGAGTSVAVYELSRIARLNGFIPLAHHIAHALALELLQGRSVFLIDRIAGNRCRGLVEWTLRSPRAHVLLVAGREEVRHVPSVRLERVATEALKEAVLPRGLGDAMVRRIDRAAAQSAGLPGRFARALWGHAPERLASRAPAGRTVAAEQPATFGEDSPALSEAPAINHSGAWVSPGELATLRRRMDAAIADLGRGRHAPGDRGLRFSVAGLARRNDWSHSVRGALALASSLLQRGRPRDAQDVLADAKEYAVNAGHQPSLMEVAVLAGVAWTDLARLDEAESVLHAALAAARSGGDPTWIASSSLALARCLFWRGKYAEANRLVESTAVGTEPTDAAAIRVSLVAARVAVGLGDLRGAVARTTKAVESAAARGDSALVAEAACTAAFAHLSIGDRPAVDRDVATAVRAARSVRNPLRALRARLLGAEIARRFGCPAIAATLLARVGRLSNAKLPATVRARCALLSDLLSASSPSDVVRRHTAATGLNALALYVASESEPLDAMRGAVDHVVNILALCQTAEDERVVLSEVCSRVRSRLQAVAVGFFATERAALVPLASDGSRIEPGIADRVIAARQPIAPSVGHQAIEGGAPVRYGGETLGALVARWVIGAPPDAMSATSILTMAAAASAPAVAAALAGRARAGAVAMGELLGVSAAMAEVRRSTERAAAAPFAVLVEGESGSGKELVARALHRRSARRDRPFCTLNCAALPDDLVEAELFGHARGAFTGAVAERPGVFEEAHMGTLFLDEIGELSLRAQAKLLRTIQDGELRRVGENTARRVDVRIVSATNRNLRQEVAAGRFRLDLLYRLDVIRIPVPPLRDRREDIAVLVEHFWREAIDRVGSRAALSTATVAALARYDWPGNVRELQNVLAALAVRSPKRGVVPPTALPAAFGVLQRDETWRLSEARRTFEERFVRAALVRTGGHRARAAEELGVTRQGLTKLMARLGISDAEETLHSERFITGSEAGHDV